MACFATDIQVHISLKMPNYLRWRPNVKLNDDIQQKYNKCPHVPDTCMCFPDTQISHCQFVFLVHLALYSNINNLLFGNAMYSEETTQKALTLSNGLEQVKCHREVISKRLAMLTVVAAAASG